MYNIKLFFVLLIHTFSLNRKSLRFISIKRILAVLLVIPFFTITFTINWFFLLIDEIIFPAYRKLDITKAVFIIGVPRSATTFLFNTLHKDQDHFHAFKLWELMFAPSIFQKYIFRVIRVLDNQINNPLYKLALSFDRIFFGKFVHIHDIGLTKPEEDEVIFMYNLSSLFFFYFWPGLKILDQIFYHDLMLPESIRKRNINFYYRCIQRHNFVFDKHGDRYFLSKNPTFISRMESITNKFKHAKIIYPLRTPFCTIPSTISLNAHIIANFCKLNEEYPFVEDTRELILCWYEIAENVLEKLDKNRYMRIFNKQIIQDSTSVFQSLSAFLGTDIRIEDGSNNNGESIITKFKSKHLYPKDLGINKEMIQKRLEHIFSPDLINLL